MTIKLPAPSIKGKVSLEECLTGRRSVRNFSNEAISLEDVSQLLWSAQGITSKDGFRTAPSAGALYPLSLYIVAGNVSGLADGLYLYVPEKHELTMKEKGDKRLELTNAALNQEAIKMAAFSIIITAVYEKTTWKYGQRGIQYVHMDAGHAAQNICLQAQALSLKTVPIGAFRDEEVSSALALQYDEVPLYIMPVGK